MENKICLDTDFLVDFLRNKKEAKEFIDAHEKDELATTYINIFELYYGAYASKKEKMNVEAVSSLASRLTLLNLSMESTQKAGQMLKILEKEGTLIDFRDLLIGTIALTNNFSVKTNNVKHFSRIKNLNLI